MIGKWCLLTIAVVLLAGCGGEESGGGGGTVSTVGKTTGILVILEVPEGEKLKAYPWEVLGPDGDVLLSQEICPGAYYLEGAGRADKHKGEGEWLGENHVEVLAERFEQSVEEKRTRIYLDAFAADSIREVENLTWILRNGRVVLEVGRSSR